MFRLPKLDLKPYDGDPKKWPDFIAIFRDLVHSNTSLSAAEKMALLKRSLSEEIRNGLGDSLSSSALYSEALTELKNTYGHPQIVSRAYIQSLIELPKVNNNDYKTLLKFSQTLDEAVSSLKNGGYEHELKASGLLVSNFSQASSRVTKQVGEKDSQDSPSLPLPSRLLKLDSRNRQRRNDGQTLFNINSIVVPRQQNHS